MRKQTILINCSSGTEQPSPIGGVLEYNWGFPSSSGVKNPPAMQETSQETWVQSLGWEDPLEEGMTTQSSVLAWRIPWTEEPATIRGAPKESDITL